MPSQAIGFSALMYPQRVTRLQPVLRETPATVAPFPDEHAAPQSPAESFEEAGEHQARFLGVYSQAVAAWLRKGGQERSEEQIAMLYEICCRCRYYRHEDRRCRAVDWVIVGNEPGLRFVLSQFDEQHPLRNRIRMDTESCPMHYW